MPFCEEHSAVMKCLGNLERGQEDIKESLKSMDSSLKSITIFQANGKVSAAVEKTKSSMLYWVIGIAGAAFIVGIVNVALKILWR